MDYVAVAGVIVAIVAGAIALRHYRLNRSLERVKVYNAVKRYLNAASQLGGPVPVEVEREFHDATEDQKVKLLFKNDDDRAYIALLREKANELRTLAALEWGLPSSEKKSSISLKRLHLVQWIEEQRASELERRLGKHL